jgi:hypothetical protein
MPDIMNTSIFGIDREFHRIMVCALQLLLPATSKCAVKLHDEKCLVLLGNGENELSGVVVRCELVLS